MTGVRVVALTLVAAALLAAVWTSTAAASSRVRRTCAKQTRVLSTPGGLVVGFLARGTPVVVIRRSHTGTWVDVLAVRSIAGWIRTRDLC